MAYNVNLFPVVYESSAFNLGGVIVEADEIKSKDREIYSAGAGRDFFYKSESANYLFEVEKRWMGRYLSKSDHSQRPYALEIGCGTGGNMRWLRDLGYPAIGLDHSSKSLHEARRRFIQDCDVAVIQGDAETIPIKNDSIGIIFCGSILHHLPNYDEAIKGFYESLAIDGAILVTEPCAYNPFAVIRRRFFPSIYHTPDERPFPPNELINCFRRYYDIVHYRKSFFLAVNASLVEKALGRKASKFYLKASLLLDGILMRIPYLNNLCWRINIVAIKKSIPGH